MQKASSLGHRPINQAVQVGFLGRPFNTYIDLFHSLATT